MGLGECLKDTTMAKHPELAKRLHARLQAAGVGTGADEEDGGADFEEGECGDEAAVEHAAGDAARRGVARRAMRTLRSLGGQ